MTWPPRPGPASPRRSAAVSPAPARPSALSAAAACSAGRPRWPPWPAHTRAARSPSRPGRLALPEFPAGPARVGCPETPRRPVPPAIPRAAPPDPPGPGAAALGVFSLNLRGYGESQNLARRPLAGGLVQVSDQIVAHLFLVAPRHDASLQERRHVVLA